MKPNHLSSVVSRFGDQNILKQNCSTGNKNQIVSGKKHVTGALPPIVQQIPCNLRPQRRVSASQLGREHCRIHCQTNINKLIFTLASSCPSWQSYFIWALWTKPMPSHLWFSVSGEQWRGQVLVQDSHVVLFQSTPACPITKGDTTFTLDIICKIQNMCGCVQSF